MMWVVSGALFFVWLLLKFAFHKGGIIHILLLIAISLFVIEFAAYRKARYQRGLSDR